MALLFIFLLIFHLCVYICTTLYGYYLLFYLQMNLIADDGSWTQNVLLKMFLKTVLALLFIYQILWIGINDVVWFNLNEFEIILVKHAKNGNNAYELQSKNITQILKCHSLQQISAFREQFGSQQCCSLSTHMHGTRGSNQPLVRARGVVSYTQVVSCRGEINERKQAFCAGSKLCSLSSTANERTTKIDNVMRRPDEETCIFYVYYENKTLVCFLSCVLVTKWS